jgi:fumarylacetoacetate (FAA) hydrolase family protein
MPMPFVLDPAPPWEFGAPALMRNLAKRGLL